MPPSGASCLYVILAAGLGTRMCSSTPKSLHKIARLPMLIHILRTVRKAMGAFEGCCALDEEIELDRKQKLFSGKIALVVGEGQIALFQQLVTEAGYPDILFFEQKERLGTAHALMSVPASVMQHYQSVVVLFGDTPLLSFQEIRTLLLSLYQQAAAVSFLGFIAENPTGYGRIVLGEKQQVLAIREEKNASPAERRLNTCHSGLMAFQSAALQKLLPEIKKDALTGEYYLPETIARAREKDMPIALGWAEEEHVRGVNTRAQLSQCEQIFQKKCRQAALARGVTLEMPETVFFSYDTGLARDVFVEPYVVFGPQVTVAEKTVIRSFSYLEGACVGAGCIIGPSARLRPETELARDVKIGNFVEIKKSRIGAETKINHLSYIGDTTVDKNVNIGAGTITCNYDGVEKYQTHIGEGAFIGSNTVIVAPASVGERACTAAKTLVRKKNIAPGALAFTPSSCCEKEGWREEFIQRKERKEEKL